MSDASNSTNYLTSVTVDRYYNRPTSATNRSTKMDGSSRPSTSKYTAAPAQEEFSRTNYSSSFSKSVEPQADYRSSKSKRSVEWDEENIQQHEGTSRVEHLALGHFAVESITINLLFASTDPLNYALVPYMGKASLLSMLLSSSLLPACTFANRCSPASSFRTGYSCTDSNSFSSFFSRLRITPSR